MSSSAPLPNTVKYTLKPVTSESDIPVLAQLSCLALKEDSLHVFAERYSPEGMYQDTVQKLTATLHGPRDSHFLFKAVLERKTDGTTEDPDAEETIVGFSQWKLGYAEMPKISGSNVGNKTNSSETSEPSVLGVAVADSAGQGDAVGNHTTVPVSDTATTHKPADPWAESARRLFSSYSRHIGGQRHLYLRRLIVHPSYQRQGIGQKLLDWGIELADRENIVTWLFSRPVASKLYQRNGWKIVDTIDYNIPDEDMQFEPGLAMLRSPNTRTV